MSIKLIYGPMSIFALREKAVVQADLDPPKWLTESNRQEGGLIGQLIAFMNLIEKVGEVFSWRPNISLMIQLKGYIETGSETGNRIKGFKPGISNGKAIVPLADLQSRWNTAEMFDPAKWRVIPGGEEQIDPCKGTKSVERRRQTDKERRQTAEITIAPTILIQRNEGKGKMTVKREAEKG